MFSAENLRSVDTDALISAALRISGGECPLWRVVGGPSNVRDEREPEVTSQAQHHSQRDAHGVPAMSLRDRQQVHDNPSFGIDPS